MSETAIDATTDTTEATETETVKRGPVLLRPVHLDAARFASKDAGRYQIAALHVRPDGSTEATNGHYAVRVGPSRMDAREYPERPETGMGAIPDGGALVPRETAAAVLKGLPKKAAIPVLRAAHVGITETGDVRFTTTYLETIGGATVKGLAGTFPDIDRVIPDPDNMVAVSVNAAYLSEIADFAVRHNASRYQPEIVIRFDKEQPDAKPLRFDFKAADGERVTMILMPMRPKGDL